MNALKDHYTNLVIGFGKGGKTLASWLSAAGEEVALIEKSKNRYGGTCINVACIPSKSLITNAEKGVPYAKAHSIKDELVTALRQKNYDKIADAPHATVIDGTASFLTTNRVKITAAGEEKTITADRIFINTGTRPFLPDIEGVQGEHIYTSTTLMELAEMPKRLAIIGSGFVGLEFADLFLKFGSEVTLFSRSKHFLPDEDRDIAGSIYNTLSKSGLKFISGAVIQQLSPSGKGVAIHYRKAGEQHRTVDAVLMATGRIPETDTLHLSAAGIETDEKGFIRVNDRLQTTAPNVWAIGDVNGGPQFTYISLDDFRIVKNQLTNAAYNSTAKRQAFATSVFITPPFARVGINETEAKEQGLNYEVFTLSADQVPKAAILRQKDGLLKAIVDKDTGKILGGMLHCAEAPELINMMQLAINHAIPYDALRDNIYTHPSMSESFNDLFA